MTCPICARRAEPRYRPFCSRRCADVDLARWLTGGYAIASDDPDEAEEAQIAAARALKPLKGDDDGPAQ